MVDGEFQANLGNIVKHCLKKKKKKKKAININLKIKQIALPRVSQDSVWGQLQKELVK
jgi:hypothetical protein